MFFFSLLTTKTDKAGLAVPYCMSLRHCISGHDFTIERERLEICEDSNGPATRCHGIENGLKIDLIMPKCCSRLNAVICMLKLQDRYLDALSTTTEGRCSPLLNCSDAKNTKRQLGSH